MIFEKRVAAFHHLGIILSETLNGQNKQYKLLVEESISEAEIENPWFIKPFTTHMFKAISASLESKNIKRWTSKYSEKIHANSKTNIGVVLAGNIPLVGFHDFMCVLLSGHNFVGKLSSKDEILLRAISTILIEIEPEFKPRITLTDNRFENIDAIIATGSNNTARYFEHYYANYPNIIRKNRNSIAILSGNESKEELENLANDIFLYFGLGCRNIAKIFVPEDYNFHLLFKCMEKYRFVMENSKYANNYKYYKSIYLINNAVFFDNGFILLKQENSIHSPIANLYFEYYENKQKLQPIITSELLNIQCIASNMQLDFNTVKLGKTQQPELWDYSDNIDTFAFLLNI